MKRDFSYINSFLDELQQDIYPQPTDERHTELAKKEIEWLFSMLDELNGDIVSVLDAGCGTGFCRDFFHKHSMIWTGITLNKEEWRNARLIDKNIYLQDMNFLSFFDDSFDLIFARHILEHSPMPLLTLMEWHRISLKYLFVVMPNPEVYGYIGRNHYSVSDKHQMRWLLRRAGWKVLRKLNLPEEYAYLCEKAPRIGYEGWAKSPLANSIYEDERDNP